MLYLIHTNINVCLPFIYRHYHHHHCKVHFSTFSAFMDRTEFVVTDFLWLDAFLVANPQFPSKLSIFSSSNMLYSAAKNAAPCSSSAAVSWRRWGIQNRVSVEEQLRSFILPIVANRLESHSFLFPSFYLQLSLFYSYVSVSKHIPHNFLTKIIVIPSLLAPI